MEAATPVGGESRAAIIDAALDHFLDQGVAATTMKEIQGDAGVSNGSLFHHFETKETLAGAVYADCAARHQRAFLDELALHDDAESAVKGIVRMHLRWCVDNPGMARFLVTVSEPAVLTAAETELKQGNERSARPSRGSERGCSGRSTNPPRMPTRSCSRTRPGSAFGRTRADVAVTAQVVLSSRDSTRRSMFSNSRFSDSCWDSNNSSGMSGP
jgi:AcrR family transcriptional regulator